MIFVDLDNTLYNQGQYLKFVFRKISRVIEEEFKVNSSKVYSYLLSLVREKTLRYPVFDSLISKFSLNISSKELINLYRVFTKEYLEKNKIVLYKSALDFVSKNRERIIVYTEGNREIQELKIGNIERNYKIKLNYVIVEDKLDERNISIFKKYSPSIYIGDDVFSDFFIPNKLGILTIRVLTGLYRNIRNEVVDVMYRPKITVRNIRYLSMLNYYSVRGWGQINESNVCWSSPR